MIKKHGLVTSYVSFLHQVRSNIKIVPLNPSKPTHIAALVSYQIFPAKMGGQKGIALFYQYLSGILPVTMISTKNNEVPSGLQANFLPVLDNSILRYVNPFLFFKLRNILRKNNCTHLILEHPYYGWLGILLKWFCNIKLVVHSHNIEALRFKSTGRWWWRILWQYEKLTYRSADIDFFITEEDREFAIKQFKLFSSKCHTITYGFEMNEKPLNEERQIAKKKLQELHPINEEERILLFNGTLFYKPNLDAVDAILSFINPLLQNKDNFHYKLIICGKGLPDSYNELNEYKNLHIIYAGFVDDINLYFKGADIFINPVRDGGGIKTKLVEALGFNLSAVSTKSGAIGLPFSATGQKLYVVEDSAWADFAEAIVQADINADIPAAFFEHFYWGNIANRVKQIIG